MIDKKTAVMVSKDPVLSGEAKHQLSSEFSVDTLDDMGLAYSRIKELSPDILLLDIRDDTEAALVLADRVTRFLPDTRAIALSAGKDPDTILAALKSGVCDYINLPLNSGRLNESVSAVLERKAHRRMEGDIYVMSSNKGGQGVTTLSVNLASLLSDMTGQRVLLVDLRQQAGDVALFLDIENHYTVADLLKDMPRLDENLLFSSLAKTKSGLYVLPAQEKIDKTARIGAESVSQMLQVLKEHMDYIIVDVAHEFSDLTAPAMDLARQVLLVTEQTVPALRSVRETLDLFTAAGYGDDKIAVIINRYEKGKDIDLTEIETLFEKKVLATIANDYKSVIDAINKGRVLDADHERSPANRDIKALAQKLSGWEKTTETGGRGWFLRLFDRLKN